MAVVTPDLVSPSARRYPAVSTLVREQCFTAENPPLALGCAVCGHPPYAHGCSALGAHDYEVPSAESMAERLNLYTALGLHRRRMSKAEFRIPQPQTAHRTRIFARARGPKVARAHAPGRSSRQRPQRERVFPPNWPEPGEQRQDQPATTRRGGR
ncbi:hypothetical protein [Nonomuraea longicatena]|uniref:Uncharacterized protein n=1 Tax=Nonomuraea longicatena TaxID=83682 RepID=A0ABN1NVR7_9ACTN